MQHINIITRLLGSYAYRLDLCCFRVIYGTSFKENTSALRSYETQFDTSMINNAHGDCFSEALFDLRMVCIFGNN